MTIERSDITFPIETRNEESLNAEQRIMTLRLVPYGEVSYLTKYAGGERFVRGAFKKAAAEFRGRRTPFYLFRSHNHDRAVGRAVSVADTAEGPLAEFRVASTALGDEVVEEYREGLLGAVSIGFRAIIAGINRTDGVRDVREAALLEASVLPIGAYEGAEVVGYRAPEQVDTLDLSNYLPPPAPVIDLSLPWGRRV